MYKFLYTERNNEKATEFETKSLLYLLSMREDSNEIDTFLIDCFNDVTGTNKNCNKLWDIQSKGVKSLNSKKIGKALITLFENYKSDINFDFYILFFPQINSIYFINDNQTVFGIENFKENNIQKIKNGLLEEYINRHQEESISDNIGQEIEEFIKKVSFVIAEDNKSKYIKNIMDLKKALGGRVKESDIDFKTALNREIVEEVGVEADIEIEEFITSTYATTFDDRYNKEQTWIYIVYKGKLKSGELKIAEPNKCIGYERYKIGEVDENELSNGAKELYRIVSEKYNYLK